MNFRRVAPRSVEWCQIRESSGRISFELGSYFKQNSQAVELVGCKCHFVVVNVSRYQPDEKLQIGLNEVKDNLIVSVSALSSLIPVSYFLPRRCSYVVAILFSEH